MQSSRLHRSFVLRMLLNCTLSAYERKHISSSDRSYIYTIGTWVYGENSETIVTDTTPIKTSVPLVAWRPAVEDAVINNATMNGIVIRPALLYGRSGSILAALFKTAYEGKVSWVGKPGGRYPLIHADDCAELYLLVTEKAQLVGGKIFDGANDFTKSLDDILEKPVRISGAQAPHEYREPSNCGYDLSSSSTGHSHFAVYISVRGCNCNVERPISVPILRGPYLDNNRARLTPRGLSQCMESKRGL